MHRDPRQPTSTLGRERERLPRLMIGTACLLAVLFAAGIEAVASHRHDSLSCNHQCTICLIAHASADAPTAAAPKPVVLIENRCRLDDSAQTGPCSSHLNVPRLRAPPAV